MSWIEFSHLLKNKKLRGENIDIASTKRLLDRLSIHTYIFSEKSLDVLDNIPILTIGGKKHGDPFDRGIIAQSIATQYTLISSDLKFPAYRKYGLDLIEI